MTVDDSRSTPPAEPQARLLYTPVEAARSLGIGRSTLYELLAAGHLRSVHIGASRRIPAAALADYVDRLTTESDGPCLRSGDDRPSR